MKFEIKFVKKDIYSLKIEDGREFEIHMAVLDSDSMWTKSEIEEETITKLADPKGFSGEYISNLFANDDYIYVTNTTNGVKGVKTSIFDFDGNLIKQVNVEDKLNISPETNNFNTQGLIDYKGAAIIIGLSWDGAYSGGYAYSISMK